MGLSSRGGFFGDYGPGGSLSPDHQAAVTRGLLLNNLGAIKNMRRRTKICHTMLRVSWFS